MNRYPINISLSGAVLLGPDIVCDGFHRKHKIRVQTHIHQDHMSNFNTSKMLQHIYLMRGSFDLLVAEYDAELENRIGGGNFYLANHKDSVNINGNTVEFLHSNHMLGSTQVAVELKNGLRLGYSSDFSWPIDDVIQVEALVVDSTAGPRTHRKYSQDEIEEKLGDLVISRLHFGQVYIRAHRGTLQRCMQVLSGLIEYPMLGSERLCKEICVYQKHGYSIKNLVDIGSQEGKEAIKESKYIRFFGRGNRMPVDYGKASTIDLSAYMTKPNEPILQFSDRAFAVALSDHADFKETIKYVKETNAKYVITDNSRGGHAFDLANEIQSQLNINAIPAECTFSHEWGE